MGNPMGTRAIFHLEHNLYVMTGFIALAANSDVIGSIPTATPPGAGPYTSMKGIQKALGVAGSVITQPHMATGVYSFTLDEPWFACYGAWAQPIDQGAVSTIDPGIDINVRNSTTAPDAGQVPGTNPAIAAQTVRIRWRTSAGTLADPAASTGFWLTLLLKNTAIG
jgi:hypothetical protein